MNPENEHLSERALTIIVLAAAFTLVAFAFVLLFVAVPGPWRA